MAVATMHVLHGIVNSSTFISEISNARATSGIETMINHSAGMVNPQAVGNMGQNPGFTFSTPQVKKILDLTGVSIANLAAANTDFYMKKVAERGSRVADATTEHVRLRAAEAVLVCDSISAGHRTDAVANCQILCPFDGTNEPLVPIGNSALSGTPGIDAHYVAGPVALNGSALGGVQDININFGRTLIMVGGDGELYLTFVAEAEVRPVITINCYGAASMSTFGLNGTALTAGAFYLRKRATTGRVANGTAEHILFEATAGLIYVEELTGGNNEPVGAAVTVIPVADSAATTALTVDTTAAIS